MVEGVVQELPPPCCFLPLKEVGPLLPSLPFPRPPFRSRADIKMDKGGRSKGWGIVKFNTLEEAMSAIAGMNASDCEGRSIEVRLDRGGAVTREGEVYE